MVQSAINLGNITISAQQSRFHTEASEPTGSKEITIKDLNISIGQREIITHADISLLPNVHYVLSGLNGTGKSTLLRVLASGRCPGVAKHLRVLFLEQSGITTTSQDDIDTAFGALTIDSKSTKTVLQHIITSDSRREEAIRKSKLITAALESENALNVVRVIRTLNYEQAELELRQAEDFSNRTSGSRGVKARKELRTAEQRALQSKQRLDAKDDEITLQEIEFDNSTANELLQTSQAVLDEVDADTAEKRAKIILLGLGFSETQLHEPVTSLSGGWQTRCQLACALFQPVDILLLDECTNYLDLPALIWLQDYIQNLEDTTVVSISHDREFVDAVAEKLLVLRDGQIEAFNGNLSTFIRERKKKIKYMSSLKASKEKQEDHMKKTIQGNIKAAKTKGDDAKLKQAASRRKKLENRSGLEVNAKGGKFKLNRDLVGYHLTARAEIDIPTLESGGKFSFAFQPSELRNSGALVSLESVSFGYKASAKKTLDQISLTIHPRDRVGICGLNGSGKSTFLKLITKKLVPQSGVVSHHPRALIKQYSQHAVDRLHHRGQADSSLTALKFLCNEYNGNLSEPNARKVLGSLGLSGQVASDVPVSALSGGQLVRLELARLLTSGCSEGGEPFSPHLLILDEVTTHLDSISIDALINALKHYQGALLIVTHDRHFMKSVVERKKGGDRDMDDSDNQLSESESDDDDEELVKNPGRVYRMAASKLKKVENGMDEYTERCKRRANKLIKST